MFNRLKKIISGPGPLLPGKEKINVGSLAGIPVGPDAKGNQPLNPPPGVSQKDFDAMVTEQLAKAPVESLSLPAEQVIPCPADATGEEKQAHAVWVHALKALAICTEVYEEFLQFRMSPRMAACLKKMQIALGLPDPPPLKGEGRIISGKALRKLYKGK